MGLQCAVLDELGISTLPKHLLSDSLQRTVAVPGLTISETIAPIRGTVTVFKVVLQCNNEIHDWHRVPFLSLKGFRICGFSYSCHNDLVLVFCQAKFEIHKTSDT